MMAARKRRSRPRGTSTAEARQALLDDAPLAVGTRWTDACLEEMRREHRVVTGGWPGTVSEARGHTQLYLQRELAERRMAALTHDELTRVASATYQMARGLWLRQQNRSTGTDD